MRYFVVIQNPEDKPAAIVVPCVSLGVATYRSDILQRVLAGTGIQVHICMAASMDELRLTQVDIFGPPLLPEDPVEDDPDDDTTEEHAVEPRSLGEGYESYDLLGDE